MYLRCPADSSWCRTCVHHVQPRRLRFQKGKWTGEKRRAGAGLQLTPGPLPRVHSCSPSPHSLCDGALPEADAGGTSGNLVSCILGAAQRERCTCSRQFSFGRAAARPVRPTAPVSTTSRLTQSTVPQRSGVHSGCERKNWYDLVLEGDRPCIHSTQCEVCWDLRPGLSDFLGTATSGLSPL